MTADLQSADRYTFETGPFAEGYRESSYFVSEEIRHRIELLVHLLEYSQQIVFISGPEKAGKSAFVHHWAASLDENWIVSQVDGGGLSGPDALVRSILPAEFPLHKGESETISVLNRYLAYCNDQSRIPVVIVDNAAGLTQSTLNFIFQLTRFRDRETYLRIVLVGEEPFSQALYDAAGENSKVDLIHTINIPPFTQEQTADYLAFRLSGAGLDSSRFSSKEAQRIFKVSGGLVGDVNFLARQGLSDPAQEGKARVATHRGPVKTVTGLFALALLMTVVTAFFIYSGDDRADISTATRVAVKLPPAGETRQVAAPRPEKKTVSEPPDAWMVEGEEELKRIEASIRASEHDERGVAVDASQQASAQLSVVEPEVAQWSEAQKTGTPPEAGGSRAGAPRDAGATAKQAGKQGVHDAEWLETLENGRYVLQLIGALEAQTVKKFIDEAGLDPQQLALYRTRKSGKDWFVLVYGQYEDIATARSAIEELPLKARAASPWAKSIEAIRKEIVAARQ